MDACVHNAGFVQQAEKAVCRDRDRFTHSASSPWCREYPQAWYGRQPGRHGLRARRRRRSDAGLRSRGVNSVNRPLPRRSGCPQAADRGRGFFEMRRTVNCAGVRIPVLISRPGALPRYSASLLRGHVDWSRSFRNTPLLRQREAELHSRAAKLRTARSHQGIPSPGPFLSQMAVKPVAFLLKLLNP